MSAIDDIEKLLAAMKDRGAEIRMLEGLLGEISVALSEGMATLDRMAKKDPAEEAAEKAHEAAELGALNRIADCIAGLQITAPAVNVMVPQAPAPQIMFMPSEERVMKGWSLTITQRDANGGIRKISLTPEA